MLTTIFSMSLNGIEGRIINVEVDISNGLPSWEIVGLPDASIRESKERVRTAIKNSGYEMCSKKIVINLAPTSARKEGAIFDLAIAVGILKNLNVIMSNNLNDYIFVGELCLNGKINGIKGVLVMCTEALKLGFKNIIVPYVNKEEAGVIEGLNIYPVKTLEDVVRFLNGEMKICKYVTKYDYLYETNDNMLDFADVRGQNFAKRAMEIVAAGAHNCLMIGSPGTGKTMLAKRLQTILPKLDFEETIEVTQIHSIVGLLAEGKSLITQRPFRNPHHTISKTALIGGGRVPKPGEISLAHNGVLYLDEIAEFDREVLELLRTPLEDNKIRISRMNSTVIFPSKFIFLASMNPCPCGFLLDKKKKCMCTEMQIQRYRNKISGPLLDRIDIHIEMPSLEYKDFKNNICEESSETIRDRVIRAREIQKDRYEKHNILVNSEMNENLIKQYCKLNSDANRLLENAYNTYSFSARTMKKIIKVARTIADLDDSQYIKIEHVAEAIQYRIIERK